MTPAKAEALGRAAHKRFYDELAKVFPHEARPSFERDGVSKKCWIAAALAVLEERSNG